MFKRVWIAFFLLTGGCAVYSTLIEPNRVTIREVTVPSEPLASFFGDATVIHLSDFHSTRIGLREKRVIQILERLDPDYVFITGDFTSPGRSRQPVLDMISRIPARRGIWGVLGNVDYDGSRESCMFCHAGGPGGALHVSPPLHMLRNESISIEKEGETLTILGLDEFAGLNGGPRPAGVLNTSGGETPRIVLAHTSFLAKEAAKKGVDLYLCGDTHGGQILLPTGILANTMPKKHWEYRQGRFRIDRLWLYVNRGIGWSIFPLRIGCTPEVAVLRFREES